MSALVVCLLARSACAQPAAEQALGLSDFAYSVPLTGEPGRAVQTVLVPLDVYLNVLRKDLGDVRVFSDSGQEVPHAVRRLSEHRERELPPQTLPLFPLREAGESASLNDLEVHVTHGADGSIVDIRSSRSDASEDGELGPIVAYVLDASAAEHPIASILITLDETEESYVFALDVQASDDLTHWRAVASQQSLARLEFEGNRIEHKRIALTPSRSKYLRLSWDGDAPPAAVVAVEAQFQRERIGPKRLSVTVRGQRVDAENETYAFDTPGLVPADRLQVQLPTTHTLIKATISSADKEEGPWHEVMDGRVYRIIEQGQELTSPSVAIPTTSARFWRMEVHTGNGDVEPGAPSLKLEYLPEQLLFVSKEQSVHQLAYGSYKAEHSKFTVADILSVLPLDERKNLPLETATSGSAQRQGGQAAVTHPPPPAPIKTYILWAVLIVSALILGLLALRLARNVR
jgi:hypothetical protein